MLMLDADTIVARRRYKRSASLWRVLAVLAVAAGLLIAVLSNTELAKYSDHVARVQVEGLIRGDQETLDLFAEIEKTDRVKAVIVHIDSPGGTTAGSEALYEAIRKVAAKKPVVAVMGTVAASGGYITAIAADHIVARGNTITGSIGVIFQWAEITQLLDNLGVRMEEVKSSKLKAEPNMFKPLTEEVRQVTKAMIDDSFNWFVTLVAERRKLSRSEALTLADGRVYTGRQALKGKLIDELGGEDQAKNWLKAQKDIAEETEVLDWKPDRNVQSSAWGLQLLARALGLEHLFQTASDKLRSEGLQLDGLMSVWHPARN